ncbi:hypothetical protein CXF59_05910 [Flavobacterium sp. ALD4]|nr:hypothetical protein CXF59_05910 [Flavobacterium sp. ALD4]
MTNSVLEEVGLRGATMITKIIKTNVAILIDVCHHYSIPIIEKKIKEKQKLGNGLLLLTHRQFKIALSN